MATKIFPPETWHPRSIDLPASKSISNRLLIIQHLCKESFLIENLSDSDDTNALLEGLQNLGKGTIDIGHAGTAMRFLTAVLASTPGNYRLTGSSRMKERPIGELVEALNSLGAHIQFEEQEGYAPLLIEGKQLQGGRIKIPGNVSSQYISALMLVAPTMPQGLIIELDGEIISHDYIKMTAELMKQHGIQVSFDDASVRVVHGEYEARQQTVESDWSAASYWYEIMALGKVEELSLVGLFSESMQGDRKVVDLFETLGLRTEFTEHGAQLKKIAQPSVEKFAYDFSHQPDLAQTLAVTLCGMGIPFQLSGLHNLRIKETDRIEALVTELMKFGYTLEDDIPATICWDGEHFDVSQQEVFVATYEDHRMAMAFAPLAIVYPGLIVMSPGVVTKSYPHFWDDLFNVGFRLKRV